MLWLNDRGHFGLYVEQCGHRRVHGDAWVYSEFLPIDAAMTTPEQALQALYYTEWGLERIRLPFGGQLCQPSNWVPSKWSVRDMFGGDMWHLALAYFQTGLADEGWELLLGAMLESAYAGAVPGGFSQIGAGTDFSDCKDMFARAVVEGLFGYDPDYPNGVVHLRPAFPSSWPKASIRTPDYTFCYRGGRRGPLPADPGPGGGGGFPTAGARRTGAARHAQRPQRRVEGRGRIRLQLAAVADAENRGGRGGDRDVRPVAADRRRGHRRQSRRRRPPGGAARPNRAMARLPCSTRKRRARTARRSAAV